ncbi:MAG: hypothetical protein Q7S03_01990 [bacterium]|nr:hypothetical protein [bacterium]
MSDIYDGSTRAQESGAEEPEKTKEELGRSFWQTSRNPLSAFRLNPRGIHFATQEAGEEVILLLRKHWITNLRWIFIALIGLVAPVIFISFPLLSFLPVRFQLMTFIIWYLLVLAFIFEQFVTWFYNVYIVTNKRLVDVDFHNLLYKQISGAEVIKIQDTTIRIGGVVRTLFNYGDLLIQTAGEEDNIDFEAVPDPEKVVKILDQLRIHR